MRLLVLVILSIFNLSLFAQKQMTKRNYENEDGDMVVCDTIYADPNECFDDTITCDTVYVDELQSGDNTFALAQQYRTEGKYFETVIALYQSWLMGKQDEVDSFIGEHDDVKKALSFVMFWENEPLTSLKSKHDVLEGLRIDTDKEMCVFLDFLEIRYNGMDEKAALKEFRTTLAKKYKDNPFFLYLNALIEYDDEGELKDVVQSFEGFKDVAEQGIALAFADIARKYANGSGTLKDCDKAIEYFQKTVDAGLLVKHDAQEFLRFINDNPDVPVSDELRVHLMRTISINIPYWLKIQKRINNIIQYPQSGATKHVD